MSTGVAIFSLKGKTALVTGGTGYLGTAMVRVLAEAGAHVLVNSRVKQKVELLVEQLNSEGLSVESAVFNVTSQNEVSDFFAQRQHLDLDILVNNAYGGGAGNIEHASLESYRESYDITVVAAHSLFQSALPLLRRSAGLKGDASVINIASMYAMVSPDYRLYDTAMSVNPPFYGAAKAALVQWTRYAACEFGREKIRVNTISPGPFPSLSVQKQNPSFVDRLKQKVPMGRVGLADEMKGPVLFLASSASSFVNGANIVVDGGWTVW